MNTDPARFNYLITRPMLSGDEEEELKELLDAARSEEDEWDWDEDGYDDGGV